MVGIMALYSSSPPTYTWGSQCSVSSKSSSAIDIESTFAQSPKSSVQGGLSSLFHSNAMRLAHTHSAGDVLDSSPSTSVGCLRGGDSEDYRPGAMNIPVSSLKARERSPASVLQGPISRSGGYGSPLHSAGLPPLDPHGSSRRRSSLSGERERWTVSRSVGFEVGNTATDRTERTVSEPVRVEGFGTYGNSPLDTLTLPLYTAGKSLGNSNSQRSAPGILEAREKILRLAEEANGILTEKAKVDHEVETSADELLRGAQSRFRVFCAPVVIKAFRMAEEAHKGQVSSYFLMCLPSH